MIGRHARRHHEAFAGDADDGGPFGREERVEREAELLHVAHRERVRVLDARRAGFRVEAIRERLAHRVDAAPGAGARFEDQDVEPGAIELRRCGQAGEAGAQHDDTRARRRLHGQQSRHRERRLQELSTRMEHWRPGAGSIRRVRGWLEATRR